MNKSSKFKFLIGILMVFVLVAGLLVYLQYSMSRSTSRSARIDANTYTIGVDYSGIIEKQYIEEGQTVKTGDSLFEIRSSALAGAIADKKIEVSTLIFDVTKEGNILLKAANPGVVNTVNYREGTYVPANSELASVSLVDTLFVTATYRLSPPDYARIKKGSTVTVTLPDNKKITAKVFDISLVSKDNEVDTIIKAEFDASAIDTFTFAVGTPVQTVLHFEDGSWFQSLFDKTKELLQPSR